MESKSLQNSPLRHMLWLSVPLFVAVLYTVSTLISSAAYRLALEVTKTVMLWDPSNCYLVISVHHVFQAIIAFAVILLLALIFRKKLTVFGFNCNQFPYALRSVLMFSAIWFVIQLVASLIFAKTHSIDPTLPYPLSARNFIGHFLFEILLSGTSEEILFRAMAIPPMLFVFQTFIKKENVTWGVAIGVATLVFTLTHIIFNLNPFAIKHANPAQLVICIIFGIYYGILMKKTGSILGPMLAHNLLNGVCTFVALLMTL